MNQADLEELKSLSIMIIRLCLQYEPEARVVAIVIVLSRLLGNAQATLVLSPTQCSKG